MARVGSGMGFFTVFNIIPEVMVAVEARSRSYPKKKADDILKDARRRIHRLTGELQDTAFTQSIQSGKTAEIHFPSDHAAPVEYGTYKMSARPYLTPAIMANWDDYFNNIFTEAAMRP